MTETRLARVSIGSMDRHRVRIRFRKEHDLRWLGHRDLVRAWERAFRRAGVEVNRSEGFHPRPRLMFPSALGLGIAGLNEPLEAELAAVWPAEALQAALAPQLPPGLSIVSVGPLPPGARKARVQSATYELALPDDCLPGLAERMAALTTGAWASISRDEGRPPVDVAAGIDDLRLEACVLTFKLRVAHDGSVRPREVLEALDLRNWERPHAYLRRSFVELAN